MENFTAADDRTVIELFLNIVRTAVPFLTLYSHIKKDTYFLGLSAEFVFPCTRKRDPRSAFKRIDTF